MKIDTTRAPTIEVEHPCAREHVSVNASITERSFNSVQHSHAILIICGFPLTSLLINKQANYYVPHNSILRGLS